MLDKMIHVNSRNETLDFLSLGIFVNYNDLRDYEWQVTSDSYGRITGFTKGIVKKTIPFVFYVSEAKANEIKNTFYEHFDKDVLSLSKGFFEINGYKYYCYVTKSVKSNYLANKRLLYLSLEVTTDDAFWIKERVYSIDFKQSVDSGGLQYPFRYPFTYKKSTSVNIMNENFVESDGIIRVYGNAINPLVQVGDNIYQVNVTIDASEYIEINTKEKTIYKYSSYGEGTNIFHLRNKEYDVFKKIPSGQINVTVNDEFKIDIVCFERRGEPKWN